MLVPLSVLLDIAKMSSSSYYDECQRDYAVDETVINEIKVIKNKFKNYGYRKSNHCIETPSNHKKILRIMKNGGFLCDSCK